jgi:hypothetical protein
MYSILKDFAGPAATVIAAGAASFVAYHFGRAQSRIANENLRATQQRVVLDLFDRRWEIVAELRSAISEILREGTVPTDAYHRYVRASLRAAFLFGSEVTDYLETVRLTITKVIALRGGLLSENDDLRTRSADAEATAFERITGFYEIFDRLVRPYMSMHQKLPE